jgi:hypothetical protein
MPQRNQLSPSYSSGRDFAVEVAGVRFCFSAEDFASRVGAAALRLGVVERASLGAGELEDLVALAAHGAVASPASALAAHIERHRETLLGGGEDLVHWLRRLVFRGAWIDQQVADGRVEPVFEEGRGFVYRSALTGAPAALDPAVPDWSRAAFRGDGRT